MDDHQASKSHTTTPPDMNAVPPPGLSDDLVKKILVEGRYVAPDVISKAEAFIGTHHISFLDYILVQNIVTREVLGKAVAKYYGLPFADLEVFQPSKERISMIPADIGQTYRCVVFKIDNQAVTVATDNPQRPGLTEILSTVFPSRAVKLAN